MDWWEGWGQLGVFLRSGWRRLWIFRDGIPRHYGPHYTDQLGMTDNGLSGEAKAGGGITSGG